MPTCRQYLSYSREWRDMAHSHIYLSVPLLVCVDKVNRFSFAFRCSSTTVQPTKQIQSLLVLRPRNIVSVAVAATAPPLLLLLDPVVVVYGYSALRSEWVGIKGTLLFLCPQYDTTEPVPPQLLLLCHLNYACSHCVSVQCLQSVSQWISHLWISSSVITISGW